MLSSELLTLYPSIAKIVAEALDTGKLVHCMRLVRRQGYCSTTNILKWSDMPLVTKYRLYMAYIKDSEETPLSYLDVEQHYVYWDLMKPENYCDGDIYKLRQSYDRLMFFLKPHIDDSVEEAYEDSAIAIVERKAGVCGGEFAEEYALDCKNRALDMQRSQS